MLGDTNMLINTDIIHTHHDLDALIAAARLHPTQDIIERLIDLEIDYHGNAVGFDQANYVWRKAMLSP